MKTLLVKEKEILENFLIHSSEEDDDRRRRLLTILPPLLGKVELKCSVLEHHRKNKHHLAARILKLNDITTQLARHRGKTKNTLRISEME